MSRSSSFAESIETATERLGWSFSKLAAKIGISAEYMERIRQGRPIPEVEERIHETLVQGFAEAAVDSVVQEQLYEPVKRALKQTFGRVAHKFQLRLEDVATLSERAKSIDLRGASSRQAVATNIPKVWRAALESVSRELVEGPGPEALFAQDAQIGNGAVHREIRARGMFSDSESIQCPNCPNVMSDPPGGRCDRCGYTLFNQNW